MTNPLFPATGLNSDHVCSSGSIPDAPEQFLVQDQPDLLLPPLQHPRRSVRPSAPAQPGKSVSNRHYCDVSCCDLLN